MRAQEGYVDHVRQTWKARWQDRRSRYRLRSCTVGSGTRVTGDLLVRNLGVIRIGAGVVVYSEPVRTHLVTSPGGAIVIGDGAILGHGVGITALERIDIGEGTTIGPFAMIIDTDFHDLVARDQPGAVSPVRIGRNVRIGPWVTVLRGAEIGDGAVVAGGSVVRGRIAPGSRVGGVPARPLALQEPPVLGRNGE